MMDNWDYNDHNEIYVIKTESLKKQYDCIVKKLQKERVKFQNRQLDQEDVKIDKEFVDQFQNVKNLFVKNYKTYDLIKRKQLSSKRRYEQAQESLRQDSLKKH
ncbi:hypothetical protein pb186bvf_004452 [Paramecium bursaria]